MMTRKLLICFVIVFVVTVFARQGEALNIKLGDNQFKFTGYTDLEQAQFPGDNFFGDGDLVQLQGPQVGDRIWGIGMLTMAIGPDSIPYIPYDFGQEEVTYMYWGPTIASIIPGPLPNVFQYDFTGDAYLAVWGDTNATQDYDPAFGPAGRIGIDDYDDPTEPHIGFPGSGSPTHIGRASVPYFTAKFVPGADGLPPGVILRSNFDPTTGIGDNTAYLHLQSIPHFNDEFLTPGADGEMITGLFNNIFAPGWFGVGDGGLTADLMYINDIQPGQYGWFTQDNDPLFGHVIPEPFTASLVMFGLAGLSFYRRKKL